MRTKINKDNKNFRSSCFSIRSFGSTSILPDSICGLGRFFDSGQACGLWGVRIVLVLTLGASIKYFFLRPCWEILIKQIGRWTMVHRPIDSPSYKARMFCLWAAAAHHEHPVIDAKDDTDAHIALGIIGEAEGQVVAIGGQEALITEMSSVRESNSVIITS